MSAMSRTNDTVINVPGRFYKADATLGAGETYDIDASDTKTGAIEIHNFAFGADCTITLLVTDDEGGVNKSVQVDTFTGNGVSQGNQIELSESENMVCRIENTSGGEADFIVTGQQVGR